MDLIIFEKQIQAETVCGHFKHQKKGKHIEIAPDNTYFPHGAIGVWCSGHIIGLVDASHYDKVWKQWRLSDLPLIPESFQKRATSKKQSYVRNIQKWVNDSRIKRIIHAGDRAREGQLIVDEVLQFVKNHKPVMRLWTKSLAKKPIQQAIKEMKSNEYYKPLLMAGLAREEMDWLIGINATRLMSLLLQQNGLRGVYPVGRVQTPLLRLIVQRERAINAFQKEPFWGVYIQATLASNDTFLAKWRDLDVEHIFNKDEAENLQTFIQHKKGVITSVHAETESKAPPTLYNLTDLQKEADQLFNMGPDETLAAAQSLYEKALITYPRSDPRVVTQAEAEEFPNILKQIEQTLQDYQDYLPIHDEQIEAVKQDKRYVNDDEVDDHHAIIPTEQITTYDTLS
ncbi:DNA topoisomerase, partial [Piscibacillus sp. B03]|uniref:DNA topoisomerase n=1 Tax=Piscibacillus sp. B03 TaxID=3457430 RepID=UPI003FCD1F04